MRVKRGVSSSSKHKKMIKLTKGMQHSRTRSYRLAKQAVIKALQYSYRDRRNKKRTLRVLLITRINAATREHGISYASFIASLKSSSVELDRKILSELVIKEPLAFSEVIKVVNKK